MSLCRRYGRSRFFEAPASAGLCLTRRARLSFQLTAIAVSISEEPRELPLVASASPPTFGVMNTPAQLPLPRLVSSRAHLGARGELSL